jgi:Na+/proline symporter
MPASSGEINALATVSVVDLYKRYHRPGGTDHHYLWASRWLTLFWGALAVGFASFGKKPDSLIVAVNLVGSLFYGTILGIFLAAFFARRLRATPVFVAAIVSELLVVGLWLGTRIGFLWFNLIGCAAVLLLASAFGRLGSHRKIPPVSDKLGA